MAEAKKVTKKTVTPKVAATKKPAVKKTVAKAKKTELKSAEKSATKETTAKVKELVEEEKTAEAIIEVEKELDKEEVATAKAGRRSAKAIKEAEALAAKEARKQSKEEVKEAVKVAPIKVRTKLERRGKKYQEVAKLVDRTKEFSVNEAIDLATKTSPVKFDATVEMHIKLGVDPRHSDQNIRGSLVLPSGTGKSVKVAVYTDVADVEKAKKAGADIAAADEFLQQLEKGTIDFDILITSPSMMPKLGKYARLLGPKGLMPNPKSGTVTNDIAKAVNEAKAGKVEYRVDSTGIVHVAIGKVSFGGEKLVVNSKAVLASIKAAKPATVKSNYIQSIFVTTTMGPSI